MKGKYEGSAEDRRKDAAASKKAGVSQKVFERSTADKKMDAAGQRRMNKGRRGK